MHVSKRHTTGKTRTRTRDARGALLVGCTANRWKRIIVIKFVIEKRSRTADTYRLIGWRWHGECNAVAIDLQRPRLVEFTISRVDPLAKATSIPPTPISLGAPTTRGRQKPNGPRGTIVRAACAVDKTCMRRFYKVGCPQVVAERRANVFFHMGGNSSHTVAIEFGRVLVRSKTLHCQTPFPA